MYLPELNKNLLTSLLEENLTLTQIGKKYNCSRQFVARRLRSFGIEYEHRPVKYPVDVDFFNKWSHKMAYILGFIMADGCVNFQKRYNRYRLKIELQLRDIEILQFIRDQISPTRPIQDNIIRVNKSGSISYVACLSLSIKKEMFDRLGTLGVVPRKSGKELIPLETPKEFIWTFILGYFDGDGCVHKRQSKDAGGYDWSICSSSRKIIKQIKKKMPVGKIEKNKKGMWRIGVRNKPQVIQVREKLYENAPFYLKRKHKLLQEVRLGIQRRQHI